MPTHLYYRVVEEAVFAPKDVAIHNHRVREALEQSTTWGELKDAMPPEEYEELMRSQFDDDGEPRPTRDESFDASYISGYADGDYPAWLQPAMDKWIPIELLMKYGSREATTLNGDYWAIPEVNVAALVDELRRQGFVVTERSDLEFC
jgi:hypothetical protein